VRAFEKLQKAMHNQVAEQRRRAGQLGKQPQPAAVA
jgi:hypothetical protein